MLHFTDNYDETLCGLLIDSIADDEWTDAYSETIKNPPDAMCQTCLDQGKLMLQETDAAWRREIAMEEGMLQGIDAYNEIMGWD